MSEAAPLVLSYFSRSVVTGWAERHGLFAAGGLEVSTVPVSSSPHQFGLLRDGGCDLALTSPDNVAAYRAGTRNPLGARLDVRILLALDAGLGLSVLARPGVSSLQELRGARIGVDVPQSGFALALFGLLEGAGLAAADYEVVELGSTPQRRTALLEGRCDATLLNAGHDIAAELAGCARLARVTDRYAPYLGAVLASSGPWLEDNEERAAAFVAVWLEATAAVLSPVNAVEVEALVTEVLGLPPAAAGRFVDVLGSASEGLVADGRVDPAALATVLDLRARRTGADVGAAPPGLIDDRLLPGG